MTDPLTDDLPPEEIERRMQSGLKRALATPPKPHSASKGKLGESHKKRADGNVSLEG